MQAQMQAQMLAKQQQERRKKQEQEENDKLASQLDSLNEDKDLLAGLEELEQKEKENIRKISSSKVTTAED
jgi:chromatin segregation and condensation protein Rec8/ScpA/Scc1 (kleisin family)